LLEKDLLNWTLDSLSKDISAQVKLSYAPLEYDRTIADTSTSFAYATSDNATYLAKTVNVTERETILVDSQAAQWQANRWAFLFEMASTVFTFDTKLQTSRAAIGDKVQISHEKLFQRVGGTDTRKIAAVQAAKRGVGDSNIQLEDLSDALTRCAVIAPAGAPDYSNSGANDRTFSGYYTDQYGLIGNDPNTHGANLIW
jgi:hypothetical protein